MRLLQEGLIPTYNFIATRGRHLFSRSQNDLSLRSGLQIKNFSKVKRNGSNLSRKTTFPTRFTKNQWISYSYQNCAGYHTSNATQSIFGQHTHLATPDCETLEERETGRNSLSPLSHLRCSIGKVNEMLSFENCIECAFSPWLLQRPRKRSEP